MGHELKPSRKRLARIRCLKECIECFKKNQALPPALCYVAAESEYVSVKPCNLCLYEEPNKSSPLLGEVACQSLHRIFVSGEYMCNALGQWCRYLRVSIRFTLMTMTVFESLIECTWAKAFYVLSLSFWCLSTLFLSCLEPFERSPNRT